MSIQWAKRSLWQGEPSDWYTSPSFPPDNGRAERRAQTREYWQAFNREALERNAQGSHTTEEWEEVKIRQEGRCAGCGRVTPLTKDHIVPLSKSGTNDISNIQGLCLSCNGRKSNHLP